MLSIEHMVFKKHLFQQNIQLMLILHMLVFGNTAALFWLIMSKIYAFEPVCLQSFQSSLFYFCFDQLWQVACSILIHLSNVKLSSGVFKHNSIFRSQQITMVPEWQIICPSTVRSNQHVSGNFLFLLDLEKKSAADSLFITCWMRN